MLAHRLTHTVLFVLALLGTAAWLHDLDEVPIWSWTRPRFVQLHDDVDQWDTVFIGSSRMNFGVVPKVFDQRMAEIGFRTRSLNFAMSGLRGHDCDECIEWLLDLRPTGIKTLVIELNTFSQMLRGTNWLTDQDIEMHAPRQLWPRLAGLWAAKERSESKLQQLLFLTMHTAANGFRLGQGVRLLDSLLARANGLPLPGTYPVADCGYLATESIAAADMREQAKIFAEEPDRPKEMLATKWSASKVEEDSGGFPMAAFNAVDARVRAAGIEPIYVVMPCYYGGFAGRDSIAEIAKRATVLDLDRPEQFPDLFDRTLWYDPGHFNRLGAAVFTQDLVMRIAATSAWRRSAVVALPAKRQVQAQITWLEGSDHVLQCEVLGLPATGDVVLALDFVTVKTDLEGSLTAWLPIPPVASQPLQRFGDGRARGRFTAAAVLLNRPEAATLHAQVAVFKDGNPIALTDALQIEVRS